MKKNYSFIKGRSRAFIYAFKGIVVLVTTEHSMIFHSFASLFVIIAGFIFNISSTEWLFQVLSIGLVFCTESLNTAIEKIANFIHPDYHKKVEIIKDIAAGTVLFATLTAITIGMIIYIPILFRLYPD